MEIILTDNQVEIFEKMSVHSGASIGTLVRRFIDLSLEPKETEQAYYRELKRKLKKERGNKCEMCGKKRNLKVHHRHYRTKFYESLDDVMLVCRECHDSFHKRSKRRELTIADLAMIDPEMTWLIEQLQKQEESRQRMSTIDFDDIDRKNQLYEVKWAQTLCSAMDQADLQEVTVNDAAKFTGTWNDVTSALLMALVRGHGWTAHLIPGKEQFNSNWQWSADNHTFRPPEID